LEWENTSVRPASPAAKDFSGAGNAGLVWENNSTGQRAIWFMKNAVLTSSSLLPTVPVEWHIAGAGDFSGDGKCRPRMGKHQHWAACHLVYEKWCFS
jgi:hypothetical protein